MRILSTAFLAAALAATASAASHEGHAQATLHNADGDSVAEATLTETPQGVLIDARFTALPEGEHGFHIHTTGACTAPDFKSAGGHFNPDGVSHGFLHGDAHHAGDMPNIFVPASGKLHVHAFADGVTFNELFDDDGAALMVHDGADDYESQPSGAAGARIACGVIEKP